METLRSIFLTIGWWTYVLIALDLFLETSAFLGVFLPGDTIVLLMGILVGRGIFSLWLSLVVIIVSAFAGDTAGYLLGLNKGEAILSQIRWVKREYDAANDHIIDYRKRFGRWIILFGKFLPLIRTVTPFSMGVARMQMIEFLAVSLFSCALWGTGWFFLGWAFGENWDALQSILRPLGFGVAGLYVIVIVATLVWRNRQGIRILWRKMKKRFFQAGITERP